MQEESLGPDRPRRTEDAVPARTSQGTGSWLPIGGLLLALWAIVPPYVDAFGDLDVSNRVEFADHVLPGIAVVAVSVLAFLLLRSPEPSQLLLFVGGATVTLAGIWMVATHMPLVNQARTAQVPWGAVLWHSLPGVAVTLLGALWTIRFWGGDEDEAAGR